VDPAIVKPQADPAKTNKNYNRRQKKASVDFFYSGNGFVVPYKLKYQTIYVGKHFFQYYICCAKKENIWYKIYKIKIRIFSFMYVETFNGSDS
jgi:hypothetical protein